MRWSVRSFTRLMTTLAVVSLMVLGVASNPAVAQEDVTEPPPPILEPGPTCDRVIDDADIDSDCTSGSIARLYLAVLDRQPDDAGLSFWVEAIDSGTLTLAEVANYFVESPEFETTYGVTSDALFVDLVHRNVLCRDADELASVYWIDQLKSEVERAEVIGFFAESPEFRTATSLEAIG